MVAITLGAVLIYGAVQVYVDSRRTYNITESTARLQETARYAMSLLEADIRMANYWGLVKGSSVISGQASQTAASAGAPTTCGTNFAYDLVLSVDGSNNAYQRNAALTFGCAAFGIGAVPSSDTLTIRRAATTPSTLATNTLQICSSRISGVLVSNSTTCAGPPQGQINDLIVHSYYIDQDSVQAAGLPSLRRKTLITGPAIRDDEILPGVEDMQIQFGIDPSGTGGTATRYINPGTIPIGAQVVSVRLWLLIRAETIEVGFTNNTVYRYADRTGAVVNSLATAAAAGMAFQPNDGFRRLLVSRTFQIRNAVGT
jgi:type IV pilus assembly protein PilW